MRNVSTTADRRPLSLKAPVSVDGGDDEGGTLPSYPAEGLELKRSGTSRDIHVTKRMTKPFGNRSPPGQGVFWYPA